MILVSIIIRCMSSAVIITRQFVGLSVCLSLSISRSIYQSFLLFLSLFLCPHLFLSHSLTLSHFIALLFSLFLFLSICASESTGLGYIPNHVFAFCYGLLVSVAL